MYLNLKRIQALAIPVDCTLNGAAAFEKQVAIMTGTCYF
jgi:hypothetical protein